MKAARQRVLVRAATTWRKKEEKKEKGKEGVSSSASKIIRKGVPKRKADGKDDRPSKKASVTFGEKQPRNLSPPKPSDGTSKGLMTSLGLVAQGTHRLLMHKGYAIEMVESIIKERDANPCIE